MSVAQSCLTLCDPMAEPTKLLSLWYSPGKNTGMDCHFLLQGIKPHSSAFLADSLPSKLPGKPLLYVEYKTNKQAKTMLKLIDTDWWLPEVW